MQLYLSKEPVNGLAVGKVHIGIGGSELGVKPIGLDGLATTVATYKAMAKLGDQ
ncbi:MAG: hypothetical protein NC356_00295 [Ruminococcus sp.]|nr:hypothetical protein [Ruminococcus sp.]